MPIDKVKGGYKIRNIKGISPTYKKAQERLKAIKASQSKETKEYKKTTF